MADTGNIEIDIPAKTNQLYDWNPGTSDSIVTQQLADYVNNKLSGMPADQERACELIKEEAAKRHLPNFKLIGASDADGDGKVDGFRGLQIGDKVYVDGEQYKPGEFKEKLSAKEYMKQGHELLKNNSFQGVEKMEQFLKDMFAAPGMTDREFDKIVSDLNMVAKREKLPMRLNKWGDDGLIITTPKHDENIRLSR